MTLSRTRASIAVRPHALRRMDPARAALAAVLVLLIGQQGAVAVPTRQEVQEALQLHGGNKSAAAKYLGCSRGSIRHHAERLTFGALPDGEPPVEELLERHAADYARLAEAYEARALIPVQIPETKPYGIVHFGDLHLDNPGADSKLAFEIARLVASTPGLYAGEVGDAHDNWHGKLRGEYAQSRATRCDGIRFYEAWLKALDWKRKLLYTIEGNHNAWSEKGEDPIASMLKGQTPYAPGVRMQLVPRSGHEVILNTRHDFPGHSIYNGAQGPNRAMMRWSDHVAVCGHRHQAAYNIIQSPVPESGLHGTGRISHCIRLDSFKRYDHYAERKGFSMQQISPICVTLIDPGATEEVGLVGVDYSLARAMITLRGMRA